MVTKSARQLSSAHITILSTPHQWWMLHQQSVINEKTQINFKGSTCQKFLLMKRCISNAWVMVSVMIMITMMNHEETPNKHGDFLLLKEKPAELSLSKHLCVCVCVCGATCNNDGFNIFNFRSGSIQMTFLRTQESQNHIFSIQLWVPVPLRSSLGCWGWVDFSHLYKI